MSKQTITIFNLNMCKFRKLSIVSIKNRSIEIPTIDFLAHLLPNAFLHSLYLVMYLLSEPAALSATGSGVLICLIVLSPLAIWLLNCVSLLVIVLLVVGSCILHIVVLSPLRHHILLRIIRLPIYILRWLYWDSIIILYLSRLAELILWIVINAHIITHVTDSLLVLHVWILEHCSSLAGRDIPFHFVVTSRLLDSLVRIIHIIHGHYPQQYFPSWLLLLCP